MTTRPNRFFSRKVVLALVIGLAIVAFLFWPKSDAQSTNGTVVRKDLLQRVTVAGSIISKRKTIIAAPYSGYIRKIFVHVGEKVQANDPVVSLAQSLKGSSDVFPMRAPFEGTVVQILKTEGEFVEQQSGSSLNEGGTIIRIDDLTQLFVDASVPETEIEKLKIGQEVSIKAAAVLDRVYSGKIKDISLAAKSQKDWDRSRVEFPVNIIVTNWDKDLKPGMSVIVDITTNKLTGVLTLPHEFIQRDGEKYFVITAGGTRKDITVGMGNETEFEIKSGLNEGEVVKQSDFLSTTPEK